MKRLTSLIFLFPLFLSSFGLFAQIEFSFIANNQSFELEKSYALTERDSFKVSTFRFYVSNIQLIDSNGNSNHISEKYFLFDLENSSSLTINSPDLKNKKFKQVIFNLGIDSITNSLGAQGGSLDPMNGMYWSWQSGYVNFKLEGNSSICPARNNKFQFHLGGFLAPYNPIQKIDLSFQPQNQVLIEFDMSQFIVNCKLNQTYQIMSPSQEAVDVSESAASFFKIKK